MQASSLAVLAAALAGHNPRHRHENGRLILDPHAGPSDLDHLVDELLWRAVPRTDLRRPRVAPEVAVAEVARAAVLVVDATAGVLGHPLGTVDRAEVAERLRATLRAMREEEGHGGLS